ncbi:MAG TPA: hypothetical protein DCR46_02860 [Cytophagales bacterium]|jgi:hypothetical protein|nr:hypothetical protein [Cytophagales bacterium]
MHSSLLKELKSSYPKSWAEFELVAKSAFDSLPFSSSPATEDLPFDLAFGLLLKFCKENELEFDYNNLDPKQYPNEFHSLFALFENTIGHYS